MKVFRELLGEWLLDRHMLICVCVYMTNNDTSVNNGNGRGSRLLLLLASHNLSNCSLPNRSVDVVATNDDLYNVNAHLPGTCSRLGYSFSHRQCHVDNKFMWMWQSTRACSAPLIGHGSTKVFSTKSFISLFRQSFSLEVSCYSVGQMAFLVSC